MKKVLVIMGSTASGKSSMGIELAKKYDGEVISCDSVQVFKGFDIGSAKVTQEEKQGIPHHLIDILEKDEEINVKLFQELARKKIDEITERHKLPILVGGTGLYIRAILHDYQFLEESSLEYRDYEYLTNEELYKRLIEKDPSQAEKIHLNNRQRLIRVNQLMDTHNITRSELLEKQKKEPLYDVKLYFLTTTRDVLVDRIHNRVENMFENGLLEEVMVLSDSGENFDYQGLLAIGYKEFKEHFINRESLDVVKELIKTHTRQFSKRQLTWFKHQMVGKVVDSLNQQEINEMIKEIETWINFQE